MDTFTFRVFGEPQPAPKKDVAIVGRPPNQRLIPVDHDYRTRKNKITGATEKWDKGYKKRWVELVQRTVIAEMQHLWISPFPKNHPIAMGCLFFLTRSKSNKTLLPAQAPDDDNLEYAIHNGLKRTPKKKGYTGRFPHGVLYYDDDQIVWHAWPAGEVWATPENPPGVLITVVDLMAPGMLQTQLREYAPDLLL